MGQVVDKVVTFVPRRVADAFVRGLYNNPGTGQVEMPPEPRELEAAVLLVSRIWQGLHVVALPSSQATPETATA